MYIPKQYSVVVNFSKCSRFSMSLLDYRQTSCLIKQAILNKCGEILLKFDNAHSMWFCLSFRNDNTQWCDCCPKSVEE